MGSLVPNSVLTSDITITDTAVLTITNDDTATVTIADISGDEDGSDITVRVTLDNPVQGGFTVDVNTGDVTAELADGDYTAITGQTLTFAGTMGEEQTFTVDPTEDNKLEADETLTISMSSLTVTDLDAADIDVTDTGTVTITNDDSATLTIADVSGNEDDAMGITVTVTLDNPVQGGFTIDVNTADDTATTADSDYTAIASQTLTFAGTAGETQTFTLDPTDDTKVETNETVTVSMDNLQSTSLAVTSTDTATVTINNDDSTSVTIADVTVNEADGTATITATLNALVDGGFTVDLSSADGTATTADNDYDAISQTLTFAGTTIGENHSITVNITDDTKVEADETVNFSLGSLVPNSVLSSDITITDTATLTITNDDSAAITISDVSGNEDEGELTVTVTLDNLVDGGLDVLINSVDGTATVADLDYTAFSQTLTFAGTAGESQTIEIVPTADTKLESDETLTVSVGSLTPNTVNSDDIDITDTGTVTVINDDSATLTIADVSGDEDDTNGIEVTVALDNAVQGGFMIDAFTTDVTASFTEDFVPTLQTLTFAGTEGETQKFTVFTIPDVKVEADEELQIRLSNLQGTSLSVTRSDRGTITILNDDIATISIDDVTMNEADGTATFRATLDAEVDGGFSVDINSNDGSAEIIDNDYNAVTDETLTFTGTSGEFHEFTVTVNDDTKVEANETVNFLMGNLSPNTVANSSINITDITVLTINNDDSAALTIADVSANEDSDEITISVSLNNAVQGGFTVDLNSTDGTATLADSDYTALVSETLTFAGTAGEVQTFDLIPTTDSKVEVDETLTVSLNNLAGTSLVVDIADTGVVTLENDDTANVTIGDVTVVEGSGIAIVTLLLDNPVDGGFSVNLSTADGTALAALDYTALTETVNFIGAANEDQIVDIVILDDVIGEETETFTVSMSGVMAGTVDGTNIGITDGAIITITDDDAPVIDTFTPLDDSVDVPVDTRLTITFDRNITANTGNVLIRDLSDDSIVQSIDVTDVGQVFVVSNVVLITPATNLPDSSELYVEVPADAFLSVNGEGNEAISGNTIWNFATEDITPPSVVLSTPASSPINDSFIVTFAFSEPVTGWDLTDINVVNGTPGILNQINPTLYQAQITPLTDGDIIISVLADQFQDLAGNDNIASNVLTIVYDATLPVVEITSSTTSDPTNFSPFQITFTISEETTSIEEVDLTLINASVNNFTEVNSTLYTMTITPEGDGPVTVGLGAGIIEDNAGNTNEETLFTVTYDGTSPFFNSITSSSPSPVNTDFPVTFTTNEPITGFTIDDLIVVNGEASSFVEVTPQEYTILVTPTITVNGNITININAGAAVDLAGNPTLQAGQFAITFDDIKPTIEITANVADPTNTDFIATITFDEDVTGFEASDIQVENAVPGIFTAVSASEYTLEIAPIDDGTVTIDIDADVAIDNATNGNEAADQFSIEYDTTRPTVEINTSVTDPVNSAFEITVEFDEEVTGFELTDLNLSNADASDLMPVSGSIYTVTITPDTDGPITIEVPENIAEDAATNGNEASDLFEILFDGLKPIPIVESSVADPTNGTFDVTITFDEPVTGLTTAGINVDNGTADSVTGSGTLYTATISPTVDGIVTVSVLADAAFDAAGNGNEVSNEFSVEFDGTNPTGNMSTDATGPLNVPFTLDIIFNENVFGFEMSDLVVTNGTPSAFDQLNLATYTVVITPDGNGDITVEIPVGVTEDLATNPNNLSSFTMEYDDSAPAPPVITDISEYTCSGNTMITGDNTLEIFGTAELGSTVEVFLNGTSIGTIATDTNGDFTFDYTGITLADGDYTFTAQATDSAMNTSALSAGFDITINTVDLDDNGIADFCDESTPQDCDGDGILNEDDEDNSGCSAPIQAVKSYGISPNGDEINDAWVIENITAFPRNTVSLYNRSGKLVFRQRNYKNTFIGISNQINGNRTIKLPVGPYIFLIDLGDGSKPIRGWLYINY